MDAKDKEILSLLQGDASLSIADIADNVGLSVSPCWRRIQQLEQIGIIDKRVTLLNPTKLGLHMTVFVQVKAAKHDKVWLEKFASHASGFAEVTEFYRMSGAYDYMLKVQVADMASFDYSTAMPLNHL